MQSKTLNNLFSKIIKTYVMTICTKFRKWPSYGVREGGRSNRTETHRHLSRVGKALFLDWAVDR